VYGFGQQTWEYRSAAHTTHNTYNIACSAEFALRSYAYLSMHAAPLMLFKTLHIDKVGVERVVRKTALNAQQITSFYLLRLLLGAVAAAIEALFCVAVQRRFDRSTATRLAFLLFLNTGMFIANTGLERESLLLTRAQQFQS
jgi:hypothetical protein